MPRITRKQVAQAIKDELGFDVELVQGNGYLWFCGEGARDLKLTSVYVCRVSHLSIESWVEEFKNLKENHSF